MISLLATAILLVLPLSSLLAATTPECEKWFFEKTDAKPGTTDCELKCATAVVGMDTFHCPSQCKELCATVLPRYAIDQLTYPPSLTDAEKDLIAKYPSDALSVYAAKLRVEEATTRYFGTGRANDESDAFRHFVWSAMVTKAIGEQKARLFLDAHEQFLGNSANESEMDAFNNDKGIKTASKLKGESKLSQFYVEKEAIQALKNGELRVLSPGGNVPDWRYQ